MNESHIQSKVREYAKINGWLAFKWVSPGNNGIPDYIFLKDGHAVFIEFKSPTGVLSAIQKAQHRRLLQAGFPVFVCNDIQQGRDFFDTF